MATASFCHLHLHTCYSLLDSTLKIKEALASARDMGMNYLAMTDHAVLYGAIEFYRAAESAGIKPIIGCDVYVARNGIAERKTQRDNMSLVLLAETQTGYNNLVKLVSRAHLEGMYYKPRIDKSMLREYSEGLIGLSGNLRGEVNEACRDEDLERAEKLALEYADILGPNNFFLELMDHGEADEKTANRNLILLAQKTDCPSSQPTTFTTSNKNTPRHTTCSPVYNAAPSLLTQTATAIRAINSISKALRKWKPSLPNSPKLSPTPLKLPNAATSNSSFPIKPKTSTSLNSRFPPPLPADSTISFTSANKAKDLYDIDDLDSPKDEHEKEIHDRFYYEVGVIEKTNYINYFLVVADFIQYARNTGIPVGPGRGSGAGSLLAYSLKITTVDPLAYSLIFERFLNPDRVSPPDFDIDFCPTRRQDVIRYVREKYGDECVAQIITFGTLGAKTLMRDLGRVLEIELPYCDRLAKMIPETPGMTLEKALNESPEFKAATDSEVDARRIMKHARLLEGLPAMPVCTPPV